MEQADAVVVEDVQEEMSTDEMVKANAAILGAVLAKHDASCVVVSYEGHGDSGGVEDVACVLPDDTVVPIDEQVTIHQEKYRFIDGHHVTRVEPQGFSFEDACAELLDGVIELAGHSGYENNSGGGGEMTLFSTGKIELEHYGVIEERHCSSFAI